MQSRVARKYDFFKALNYEQGINSGYEPAAI